MTRTRDAAHSDQTRAVADLEARSEAVSKLASDLEARGAALAKADAELKAAQLEVQLRARQVAHEETALVRINAFVQMAAHLTKMP